MLSLCVSVVSAEQMKSKTFGNVFSMDVPKDSNFVEEPIEDGDDSDIPMVSKFYVDENLQIGLFYFDSVMFNNDNAGLLYQSLFKSINPDLNKSYESQEDNVKIMEPVGGSENFAIVGYHDGNKTVIIMGNDVNTMKDMARTVEFK